MNRIGIDLGGTKIEGILLDDQLKIKARERIPTLQSEGYESILDRIQGLFHHLRNKTTAEVTVGICTPGTIAIETGKIKNSNTLCLIGQPFQSDLKQKLGMPINMENDANCFVMSEMEFGAAKGYNSIFGIIMGTGVGGGITIKGQLLKGGMNIAGEWGHHCLIPGGRLCYCGNKGCVETYISGPALERQWKEITGKSLPLKEIVQRNEGSSNSQYLIWKNKFLYHFGIAVSNVINILDPEIIVMGGGVSNIPFLYTEGVESVHQFIFSDHITTPIVQNQMGDSSGVLGAALLESNK